MRRQAHTVNAVRNPFTAESENQKFKKRSTISSLGLIYFGLKINNAILKSSSYSGNKGVNSDKKLIFGGFYLFLILPLQ